jgi:hypothetical protein
MNIINNNNNIREKRKARDEFQILIFIIRNMLIII